MSQSRLNRVKGLFESALDKPAAERGGVHRVDVRR
jgi:hypothetical protein